LRQVPVLIQRIDQQTDYLAVFAIQRTGGQLAMQVFAQAGLICRLLGIGLVFVVRAVRRAAGIPARRLAAKIVRAAVVGAVLLRFAGIRAALRCRKKSICGKNIRSRFLGQFQHGVFVQHPRDFLMNVLRGELQQTNSLLQLRGERQLLGHPDL
jgi:hypothetical protein